MKLVILSISVCHEPRALEIRDEINESFELSIQKEVEEEESTQAAAQQLSGELLRRYRNLNARKTN